MLKVCLIKSYKWRLTAAWTFWVNDSQNQVIKNQTNLIERIKALIYIEQKHINNVDNEIADCNAIYSLRARAIFRRIFSTQVLKRLRQ
jgi:hypothetical protein